MRAGPSSCFCNSIESSRSPDRLGPCYESPMSFRTVRTPKIICIKLPPNMLYSESAEEKPRPESVYGFGPWPFEGPPTHPSPIPVALKLVQNQISTTENLYGLL